MSECSCFCNVHRVSRAFLSPHCSKANSSSRDAEALADPLSLLLPPPFPLSSLELVMRLTFLLPASLLAKRKLGQNFFESYEEAVAKIALRKEKWENEGRKRRETEK